jgi:hypothetical protein
MLLWGMLAVVETMKQVKFRNMFSFLNAVAKQP